jgi:hypothetical protein
MEENVNQIENPPILKKWSRLYWAVMINLILWLSAFYVFRRIFE